MADPNQTPARGNWVCPCGGCKKARKQAFAEVIDILDSSPDVLWNTHALRQYIKEQK
jgi:hypothetical protein